MRTLTGPNPSLEGAGWMMPIAHDRRVTGLRTRTGKLRHIDFKLRLNRSCNQVLCSGLDWPNLQC